MKIYALPVSIILLALALVASVFFFNSQPATGSVLMGGEYNVTTVTSGTSTPKSISGTLGSVVIADAGTTGAIYFYATSTNSATSTADQILVFDGAAAENTYTFDVGFGGGLQVESRGFDGTAIVTYR